MNNYEFYDLLLGNLNLYLLLTVTVFLSYYFLFRRTIKTIIDPLFLPVLYSAIGTVTVSTLYIAGKTTDTTFASYCFTQVAYYSGFFLLKPQAAQAETFNVSEISSGFVRQTKLAFIFFGCMLVVMQLLVYKERGIPLFQQSRLDTYTGGSGFGIYSRFIDIANAAVIYSYLLLFFYKKSVYFKWIYHFIIVIALFFLFLSGSKTALLVIPYILFAFITLHQNNKNVTEHHFTKSLKKRVLYITLVATALVLVVIKIQSDISGGTNNPFFGLLLRLVHSGDAFWYAYPFDVYKKIDGSEPFLALFNDTLGFFRIYDWSDLPQALGISLIKLQHAIIGNYGPNARQNVFELVYFGIYGSVIFSFILGLLFSLIRHRLFRFCQGSIFSGIFFTILFINAHSLETDPVLTFGYFNNAIIIYPLLVFAFLVIYHMVETVKLSSGNKQLK